MVNRSELISLAKTRYLKISVVVFTIILMLTLNSCEEVFVPEDVTAKNEYVIEGHIELSDLDMPAYVIISKSVSYFSNLDSLTFQQLYVDDATVHVNDGDTDIKLDYVCIEDLDQLTQLKLLSEVGGKIFSKNYCLYIDKNNLLKKEAGKKYSLTIKHENNIITSQTTLANRVNLDSIYFRDSPGKPNDTMTLLWGKIPDPVGEANYYQYDVKKRAFSTKTGNTLRDDAIFNGKTIDMPFPNPLSFNNEKFDPETANLYKRGDTLLFKWCTLDREHYEFWESFQFSNNQGPFSSYVRSKDNIEGGIGIWGAYNCQVELLIVPKK
jgi:hypothetical protein